MFTTFDKFDVFETPALILCNPGSKFSEDDITQAIGELVNVSDIELEQNFNSTSSVNFRLYDIPDEEDDKLHQLFEKSEERRYLFLPGIGFYVIREAPRTSNLGVVYKDISATSCDIEFSNKLIPYIEGTYPLTTIDDKVGILNIILANIPQWSLGEVDEDLSGVYRTFTNLDDINMYDFLIDNVQKAFECVIIFDIINRTVNVYSRANYSVTTDIHLTEDDLVRSIKRQSSADDVYTALRVSGDTSSTISLDGYSGSSSSTLDSTFGIERVNPVGGNVIYNFDYYLSWMPTELAEKVQRWENAIVENDVAYSTHSMAYYTLREEESNSVLEIQRLDILIDTYTQCKNNIIETSSTDDVEKYNIIIEGHGGVPVTIEATIADTISRIDDLVADVESDKADEQANLATIRADITTENDALELIRQSTVPSRVFTSDELAELSRYTFEGSYNDKYITITDNMTQEEQFVQFRTLYVRGIDTLKSVSKPVYKFDIDTESFQYVAGYEHWAEQLVQGCSIWVEVQPDMVVELFLSGIRVNYTDKSVKLTFGSIIDRNDLKALFEDVLGTIKKTANSVSYI